MRALVGIVALAAVAGCSRQDGIPVGRRDTVVVKPTLTAARDSVIGAIVEITPDHLRIRRVDSTDGSRLLPEKHKYTRLAVLRVGLDTTHCKEENDRAAIQWNGTTAEHTPSRDTIFARDPNQAGVHARQLGTIVAVTAEDLTLAEHSGELRKIYSRDVVRRVGLDDAHCDDVKDQVASYWNRTKSLLVASVQKAPGAGPLLGFLDVLPPGVDVVFVTVLLILFLGYGGYRAYETVIVARGVRDLNLVKLRLEIERLRRELDGVQGRSGTPGATPELASARLIEEEKPSSWRLPEIHAMDFLRYKVLRLPTEEERQDRTERWAKRWTSYGKKRTWLPAAMYGWWRLINGALRVTVAMFGVGALVDVALPLTAPDEFGGAAGVVIMLIFAGLAILCLSWFLQLRERGRIIKATYREFRRAG